MSQYVAKHLIMAMGGNQNWIDQGEAVTIVRPDFMLNGWVLIRSCKGVEVTVNKEKDLIEVSETEK